MIEKILEYCAKEWRVVREAPFACLLLFSASCIILFSVLSWYYEGRISTLKDQIRTYEVKLDVVSPDEALNKMMEMNSKLNTAMDLAQSKINELLRKKVEIDHGDINLSWLEPICVSLDDTEDTKRQVLVYHLMGKELGIKSFSDENFCKQKSRELQKDKEERESNLK